MIVPKFSVGDDVFPTGGHRGRVLEIRPLEAGEVIYGVADTNGGVSYYLERALKRA